MLWADDEEGDGQVNCEEFVRACWYPSEGGVRSSHPAPTLLSSGKADSASFPQLPLSSFPPLPPQAQQTLVLPLLQHRRALPCTDNGPRIHRAALTPLSTGSAADTTSPRGRVPRA